ncbi:hypothetical protein [Hydrogenophaga sp.]|uniref:hypothetical protein n=1 Tax=Hydrogenophaga sp. TaxID=1904254 RepID=UPI002718BAEC|nr:hypothetical protein [Hydrogenophaga sp.]MDO9438626.1 hypothetical protein [Hydrogenophaga sp.]
MKLRPAALFWKIEKANDDLHASLGKSTSYYCSAGIDADIDDVHHVDRMEEGC